MERINFTFDSFENIYRAPSVMSKAALTAYGRLPAATSFVDHQRRPAQAIDILIMEVYGLIPAQLAASIPRVYNGSLWTVTEPHSFIMQTLWTITGPRRLDKKQQ